MREHVYNLRSRRCFAVVARALGAARGRGDFRVVHFSVQGNHLHLIVEADDAAAIARGAKALAVRIARGLNVLMRVRGPAFADRYHAHVLRTPAEVRHAVSYVLRNHASHAARRGEPMPPGWVDPYSSEGNATAAPLVAPARTWLLTVGYPRSVGRAGCPDAPEPSQGRPAPR